MRSAILLLLAAAAAAQVYSPQVLLKGQPDAADLKRFASGIYEQAHAATPREKAEAIWRFFLTDGRFVKPGFWYHIAGWAYEEPNGEVLDPIKLMNSYGFGLCYQVAPLLETLWKAGGFADARVWFITGHTVAEVFYDGAYHYYDSDLMGYNTKADGTIASVHDVESDGNLILKQKHPSSPWYPGDVRAGVLAEVAKLFTTTGDNWLFPFERAPRAHSMDFVLRKGERIIRYFHPERPDLFYLPFQHTDQGWQEFPREVRKYKIRTADGPHSQRDTRAWATGRIEYAPALSAARSQVFEVRSPYVIIGAEFRFHAALHKGQRALIETSADGGGTWQHAAEVNGPYAGEWLSRPAILTKSANGERNAVAGSYGYLVRVTREGGAVLSQPLLLTRFQLNPRTLPGLTSGQNEVIYSSGEPMIRQETELAEPIRHSNAKLITSASQSFWTPADDGMSELIFKVTSGTPIQAASAGARFLDLSRGLAPDKLTAEVRKVALLAATAPAASIAWSTNSDGPFQTLWEYDPHLQWRDGRPINRLLLWPEVDRRIAVSGGREIYLRYRFRNMAADNLRAATESQATAQPSSVTVIHIWKENGVERRAMRHIKAGVRSVSYTLQTSSSEPIENEAIIIEAAND
jgi:hypothetical protein